MQTIHPDHTCEWDPALNYIPEPKYKPFRQPIWRQIKFFFREYDELKYYSRMMGEDYAFHEYLQERAMSALRQVECYFEGHKIVCTHSWCTPDSGGEDHECTRCGMQFYTTYY
jgi:hypothetical protein